MATIMESIAARFSLISNLSGWAEFRSCGEQVNPETVLQNVLAKAPPTVYSEFSASGVYATGSRGNL